MTSANERQVGGTHYTSEIQHWDYVAANKLDYFQGQITKYITRWKKKNGVEDLKKARHFLDKYIELESRVDPPTVQPCDHSYDVFHGVNKTVELCVHCFEPKETT